MRSVFGVPVESLTVILTVLLGGALAVLAILGLRNRVFLRLGVRNLPRRPARTAIIVVGLMLATAIIGSALVTGDTISATMRSDVLAALGSTDERVSVASTTVDHPGAELVAGAASGWFAESDARAIGTALDREPLVDAVTPAVMETVAVQDRTSRQNEPRVALLGAGDLGGFSRMEGTDGEALAIADLAPGEAFVTREGAEALRAAAGDDLTVLAGSRVVSMRVRDVVHFHGAGSDGPALVVPLPAAQSLFDHPGEVQHLLVSNTGGEEAGAAHSAAVVAVLTPLAGRYGLATVPVKADGLDEADTQGNEMLSIFSTFGMFTITAGILLIFLIFVMLAAERRAEMGTARAVGTQRGHLVQTFVFEGAAYDLVAAAVGALVGVALSAAMVWMVSDAFESGGLDLRFAVRPRSLVLAYGLGVLLTLVVVALSAWRVSRLNVSAAIRNLPDPPSHRRRGRGRRVGVIGVVVGVAMAVLGASSAQATPFLLGVSIVLASLAPLAIGLGAPDRVAYVVSGVAIVVWWLLPFSVYEGMVEGLTMDFSIWVVAGLMLVLGGVWIVMNSADSLMGATMAVAGRIRSLAPVLRTSIAYPMRSRFRTGVTLAMFTLVVFTLVSGVTIFNAFVTAMDDESAFGGGFQMRAETTAAGAVDDLDAALDGIVGFDRRGVDAIAAQSLVPVEAVQVGVDRSPAPYPLRGLDDTFLARTTFGLAAMARGYDEARDVWAAMAAQPGLAVVDPLVAPRQGQFGFGELPAFQLSGFVVEDEVFDPVEVVARSPLDGTTVTLTVIGVLKDTAPYTMFGISTAQRALAPFGDVARPTVHHVALEPGVDAVAFAANLESAFLANGMQAEATSETLDEAVGDGLSIQRFVLWFLGLGLLIGVVALGVISARSVVERRQHIGVLRSIGFQKGMVQASFLLESSFISVTAIVMGTVLGLAMSYNVVVDTRDQPSWDAMTFQVPWPALFVVFGLVFVAGLVATALPARRAAQTYPAEALRYQ